MARRDMASATKVCLFVRGQGSRGHGGGLTGPARVTPPARLGGPFFGDSLEPLADHVRFAAEIVEAR